MTDHPKRRRGRALVALKRALHFLFYVHNLVVSCVKGVVEVTAEVVFHWIFSGMDSIAPAFLKKQHVLKGMAAATSYKEWKKYATELDRVEGNQVWPLMRRPLRTAHLLAPKQARVTDLAGMAHALRMLRL